MTCWSSSVRSCLAENSPPALPRETSHTAGAMPRSFLDPSSWTRTMCSQAAPKNTVPSPSDESVSFRAVASSWAVCPKLVGGAKSLRNCPNHRWAQESTPGLPILRSPISANAWTGVFRRTTFGKPVSTISSPFLTVVIAESAATTIAIGVTAVIVRLTVGLQCPRLLVRRGLGSCTLASSDALLPLPRHARGSIQFYRALWTPVACPHLRPSATPAKLRAQRVRDPRLRDRRHA